MPKLMVVWLECPNSDALSGKRASVGMILGKYLLILVSYISEDGPVIPASWLAGFNSISSVGQFFGGFACSWVSDRIGRKGSLLVGLIVVTGGIFGELFATSRPAFLIGKLILGIGLGFYLTIGPLYCSEVAPVVIRGMVTGGINFAIVIGQLLSNAVIKGFGGREDNWAFRGPFAVQFLFVGWFFSFPVRYPILTNFQQFWQSVFHSHPNHHGTTFAKTASKRRNSV